MPTLNILDTQAIKNILHAFTTITTIDISAWIDNVVFNYCKREPIFYQEIYPGAVKLYFLDRKMPQWIKDCIANNKPIHAFNIETTEAKQFFNQDLQEIIDWWSHLPPNDPHLKRWRRVSVPEALELSKAWHAALAKKAKDKAEDWAGIERICDLSDNFIAVKLTTAAALEREGAALGHCVGSYYQNVANNKLEIYSIRDRRNTPHVTISVTGQNINEMSGTANTRPTKYVKQLKEFIKHKNLNIGNRGHELGIFKIGDTFYESPDDLLTKNDQLMTDLSENGYIKSKAELNILIQFLSFHKDEIEPRHRRALYKPLLTTPKIFTILTKIPNTKLCKKYVYLPNTIPFLLYDYSPFLFDHDASDYLEKILLNLIKEMIDNSHCIYYFEQSDNTQSSLKNGYTIFAKAGLLDKLYMAETLTAEQQQTELKTASLLCKREINNLVRSSGQEYIISKKHDALLHFVRVNLPLLNDELLKRIRRATLNLWEKDNAKR